MILLAVPHHNATFNFFKGHVEACGSQADLLSKGLDPKHLVGVISADKQEGSDDNAYKDDNTVAGLLFC